MGEEEIRETENWREGFDKKGMHKKGLGLHEISLSLIFKVKL